MIKELEELYNTVREKNTRINSYISEADRILSLIGEIAKGMDFISRRVEKLDKLRVEVEGEVRNAEKCGYKFEFPEDELEVEEVEEEILSLDEIKSFEDLPNLEKRLEKISEMVNHIQRVLPDFESTLNDIKVKIEEEKKRLIEEIEEEKVRIEGVKEFVKLFTTPPDIESMEIKDDLCELVKVKGVYEEYLNKLHEIKGSIIDKIGKEIGEFIDMLLTNRRVEMGLNEVGKLADIVSKLRDYPNVMELLMRKVRIVVEYK